MTFSTQLGSFPPNHHNPSPVIELLIDGQAWGQPHAAYFSFGNRICRMLLSCKGVLELFLATGGIDPEQHTGIVQPSTWMPVPVQVEGYSEFEVPNAGRNVPCPYLKFSCNESRAKGVGLLKTEGLLAVWQDLEAFARERGAPW